MTFFDCLLAAGVAVLCGLDRTAALQLMVSRPIVAAPLAGLVLGVPQLGLQVGLLLELLWLGRLPVGASIPPDDTQVAVGATFLAATLLPDGGVQPAVVIFCLLIAMPLAKCGQLFDRMARRANDTLSRRAGRSVQSGNLQAVDRMHLIGLGHFALASLLTFVVVAAAGSVLCAILMPSLIGLLEAPAPWMQLVFPLVGAAMILVSINVSRVLTLFSASFASAMLMLWLL
jgi:PTS system mannose-specific IIC component